MLLKTISKPTRATCEKGIGPTDWLRYYHARARADSAGQKKEDLWVLGVSMAYCIHIPRAMKEVRE
jgi:hypothetical protein